MTAYQLEHRETGERTSETFVSLSEAHLWAFRHIVEEWHWKPVPVVRTTELL